MLELKAENRSIFGKKLYLSRKQGKIPAVLYGKEMESTHLFVDLKDFKRVWKEVGESAIVELKNEGLKKPVNVIIKDVDLEPVSNEPIHVDFYKVEMDKPITAAVPLVFEGVAPAVKELGGVLVKVMHEIEIEALPKDLPQEIKIDVSRLKTFEDRISVSDINLPKGIIVKAKHDEIIIMIEEPVKEEVKEEKTIEDIEVEKKGKEKKEEEEQKAE